MLTTRLTHTAQKNKAPSHGQSDQTAVPFSERASLTYSSNTPIPRLQPPWPTTSEWELHSSRCQLIKQLIKPLSGLLVITLTCDGTMGIYHSKVVLYKECIYVDVVNHQPLSS